MLILKIIMFIYETIQTIFLLGIGIFVFFILAFIFINTGTLIKDANKKLHYIIYLTMFLTLILSLVLLGLQYYVPIIALFSGWWIYKLFH